MTGFSVHPVCFCLVEDAPLLLSSKLFINCITYCFTRVIAPIMERVSGPDASDGKADQIRFQSIHQAGADMVIPVQYLLQPPWADNLLFACLLQYEIIAEKQSRGQFLNLLLFRRPPSSHWMQVFSKQTITGEQMKAKREQDSSSFFLEMQVQG